MMASDTQDLWGSLFKAMNSVWVPLWFHLRPSHIIGPWGPKSVLLMLSILCPSSKKAQGPQGCGRKDGRVYATGDMPSHLPRVCLLMHTSPRSSFIGCPRK